jgi:hypothetical protein
VDPHLAQVPSSPDVIQTNSEQFLEFGGACADDEMVASTRFDHRQPNVTPPASKEGT